MNESIRRRSSSRNDDDDDKLVKIVCTFDMRYKESWGYRCGPISCSFWLLKIIIYTKISFTVGIKLQRQESMESLLPQILILRRLISHDHKNDIWSRLKHLQVAYYLGYEAMLGVCSHGNYFCNSMLTQI